MQGILHKSGDLSHFNSGRALQAIWNCLLSSTEGFLGFVLAVSMALSYLQVVLCELLRPNSIARVRLPVGCHPAGYLRLSKTPENIVSEVSAA